MYTAKKIGDLERQYVSAFVYHRTLTHKVFGNVMTIPL